MTIQDQQTTIDWFMLFFPTAFLFVLLYSGVFGEDLISHSVFSLRFNQTAKSFNWILRSVATLKDFINTSWSHFQLQEIMCKIFLFKCNWRAYKSHSCFVKILIKFTFAFRTPHNEWGLSSYITVAFKDSLQNYNHSALKFCIPSFQHESRI